MKYFWIILLIGVLHQTIQIIFTLWNNRAKSLTARVSEVTTTTFKLKGQPFEYDDFTVADASGFKVGDKIKVTLDPGRPWRNTLFGNEGLFQHSRLLDGYISLLGLTLHYHALAVYFNELIVFGLSLNIFGYLEFGFNILYFPGSCTHGHISKPHWNLQTIFGERIFSLRNWISIKYLGSHKEN